METTKVTSKPAQALEFEPDAWERFERAVSIVASAPPQHRPNKRTMHRARRNYQTFNTREQHSGVGLAQNHTRMLAGSR
jgi:hypothetical protein